GAVAPASTRSRVLLPLPLGPSSPSFVPGVRATSRPANSGLGRTTPGRAVSSGPKDFAIPVATRGCRDGRPVAPKTRAAPAGVAVGQLRELFAPAGGLGDARRTFAPLRRLLAGQPGTFAAHLVGDGLLLPLLRLQEGVPLGGEFVVRAGHAETAPRVHPVEFD